MADKKEEKTEKKGLFGSVTYWVKNMVGETISSKKTVFSALSVYLLAKLALETMKENTVVAITALICATLCFGAWLFCQKGVDMIKIQRGKK